ncbi:MAG: PAS domain-containing protein [Campylobacterales bacterium]|nr:PAS domain-containing protein [Campylobacterales bacterium]
MSVVTPVNEEYVFDGSMIISQTDLKGIITFANRKFCEVSGYKASDLIGKSHNVIRHPDMPKEVFTKMWEMISSGQGWTGIIKNLRSDGRYYWVDTEILPVHNNKGELTGYIAARKAAAIKDIQENETLYKNMIAEQA